MAITFTGGQSYFKPLTFDDFMKPIIRYEEQYEKAEESLSTLMEQAEYWQNKANREKSPIAYEMSSRYNAELRQYTDAMAEGRLGTVQRNLLGMKSRFNRDIKPLEDAYNTMQEANKMRDENPDFAFEVSRYDSLDPFVKGATANNRHQSKTEVTNKTAAMIEAEMAAIAQQPEFKELLANDAYWLTVQHNGGTPEQLREALAHVIGSNPEYNNKFTEVKERVAKQIGYDNYDEEGKKALDDAMNTGLYKGLDKPVYNLVNNVDKITEQMKIQNAQEDAKIAIQRRAQAASERKARYKRHKEEQAEKEGIYGKLIGVDPKTGVETWVNNTQVWTRTPKQTQKKNADGKYLYTGSDGKTYSAYTPAGKPVKAPPGVKLTPVMETTYDINTNPTGISLTGLTGSKSSTGNIVVDALKGASNPNLTPEMDPVTGQPTGRYWNSKLRKFVDEYNNLTVQGKFKDNTSYKPLFFTAWSAGARKDFREKDEWISGRVGAWGERKELPWTYNDGTPSIRGKEARQRIKEYVGYLVGIPVEGIEESVFNNIMKHMVIERDKNWVRDNTFAVHLPGVDDEGKIVDQRKFDNARRAILKELNANPGYDKKLPNE